MNFNLNICARNHRSQEFEMCPRQAKTIYIPSINFVTPNLEEIVL